MAKYEVAYSCGHTAEIQLFGKHTERENKIAWLEREGICPECHAKQQQAERAAAAAAAKEANAELPTLEGSEKQIAWAETIRAKFNAELKEKGFRFEMAETDAKLKNALDATLYNTSAKWWIDHRELGAQSLILENYK